jgi:hypothetical protein
MFTMCDVYSFCAFLHIYKRVHSERTERLKEAQAFLRSYDLAPRPSPPPIPNQLAHLARLTMIIGTANRKIFKKEKFGEQLAAARLFG